MVISRGKYRGLKLETLNGENTRPTLAKVKEAIFSMLYNNVYDAKVLDLFAGSGNLGIEALSCEAKWVDFFDSNRDAIKVIESNTKKLKCDNFKIELMDYQNALNSLVVETKYDLIFLDPPYHLKIINSLIEDIYKKELLSEDGIIVCEYGLDEDVFDEYCELEKYKDKKYGKTKISMFRRR
ncbi:16S rRNA (guanine966-N2)-methyltransferase [Bacilli bacterium PM5-3]|nr:16S rRNA (guanine966-N2)-methyltransferase [Bacilli bacterium PM5-3]MDH6602925.1 16S rRNA (guanine966-N2)-methyltransferase [Bacilli bacterium PM5-9]